MKMYFIPIVLILFSCSNNNKFLQEVIQNPQETTFYCKTKSNDNYLNSLVIYNSEIKNTQFGIINVSLTFNSIINKNDTLKIKDIDANWISIKDSLTDSIFINQSLIGEVRNLILIRYKNELISLIKDCECTVLHFNEKLIPRKIGYNFKFVILNNNGI